MEIPTRVYQSLRRAVRRRCNLYGAVRDTPAPDWPWPWRRAANHGRGDGGVQSARATTAGGRDVCDQGGRRERYRGVRDGTGCRAVAGAGGGVAAATAGKWWGRRAGETVSRSLAPSAAAAAATTAAHQ